MIEDGDLDQWVKAKDNSGKLGYVPENYLHFPSPTSSMKIENPFENINFDALKSRNSPINKSPFSFTDQEIMNINKGTITSNVSNGSITVLKIKNNNFLS